MPRRKEVENLCRHGSPNDNPRLCPQPGGLGRLGAARQRGAAELLGRLVRAPAGNIEGCENKDLPSTEPMKKNTFPGGMEPPRENAGV